MVDYDYEMLYGSPYNNNVSTLAGTTGELTTVVDRTSNGINTTTLGADKYAQFVDEGDFSVNSGNTLIIQRPGQLIAPPRKKIITGSGAVVFEEGSTVHLGWFGLDSTGLQAAIDAVSNGGGGTVLVPEVELSIATNVAINCQSNVNLKGEGRNSVIKSAPGTRTKPLFEVDDVTDMSIEQLHFESTTNAHGSIEIKGTSNSITIRDCSFDTGYSGVWFRAESGATVKNCLIFNNHFNDIILPLYLGESTELTTAAKIKGIRILDNIIENTNDPTKTFVGIYIHQSVTDLLVQGNIIRGCGNYGIELNSSGEGVSIVGNTIVNTGIHGIWIKPNDDENENIWIKPKQLVISGNIVNGSTQDGIHIERNSTTSSAYNPPYLIIVSDNQIVGNAYRGIWCQGSHITITRNHLHYNCTSTAGHYSALFVSGHSVEYSEYISITENHVVNNGASGKTNIGITLSNYVRYANVLGNQVSDDQQLPNKDNQTYGLWFDQYTDEIVVKNNRCEGFATGQAIYAHSSADIIGETVVCRLGSVEATTDDELPVFRAASMGCFLHAYLINQADITQSDTEYIELELLNKGTNGSGSAQVFDIDTKATGGVAITAFGNTSMGTPDSTNKYFIEDETVSFKKTSYGTTSRALSHAMLRLDYLTF